MIKRSVVILWAVVSLMVPLAMGEPISVVCDEFGPAQVEETHKLVEAVERVAAELFGDDFSDDDDGASFELHLQALDYHNADKRLNDGYFRSSWAFANFEVMQGHVALQPPVPTELLDVAGLPVQTKFQIGQVTTHLLRYRAFNNHNSHPRWLSVGLAMYVSQEAARSVGMIGELVDEPWTSKRIVRIVKLLDENPEIKIETILSDTEKDLSKSELFGLRGLFMIWLDEIGAIDEVVSEARRLGGGNTYAQRLHDATLEAIESAGVEHADSAFVRWLKDFEPQWDEVSSSLQTAGNIWMHGAFSSRNASCWNSQELGDDDWALTGSFKIFDGENTQMNVLLGRSDAGYLSVAMGPSFGVTVFHRQISADGKTSDWVRLITKEIRSLKLEEWNDLKITKRRGRLMIKINKDRPVRIELDGLDISGSWGLGCQNKSAGLWRDIQVER